MMASSQSNARPSMTHTARIAELETTITAAGKELSALDDKIQQLTRDHQAAAVLADSGHGQGLQAADGRAQRRDIGERLAVAQARAGSLSADEVPKFKRELHYLQWVAGAADAIKTSQAARTAAQAEAEATLLSLATVETCLAERRAAIEGARETAESAVADAALVYAEAIAAADAGAAQNADGALRLAQARLVTVERDISLDNQTCAALEVQAKHLDELHKGHLEAEKQAARAIAIGIEGVYSNLWDDAVDVLAAIGAKIFAAREISGRETYCFMESLHISKLNPAGGSIGRTSLERLSRDVHFPEV
nr:hypothetical protein [Zoogloeaceae bacterium]